MFLKKLKLLKKKFHYSKGLKFSCIYDCDQCCRGEPGIILVSKNDMENISTYLNISIYDFMNNYSTLITDLFSINYGYIKKAYSINEIDDGSCIFLKDKKCLIYPVRPLQCRSYPFWPSIIKTEKNWEDEKRYCPGINRGKLYSFEEISKILEEFSSQNFTIDKSK